MLEDNPKGSWVNRADSLYFGLIALVILFVVTVASFVIGFVVVGLVLTLVTIAWFLRLIYLMFMFTIDLY